MQGSEALPGIHPLLVVDDEENNRDLLARRLKRAGFAVETANDGPEALQLIRENEYDLVLLDHMMPGMTGIDVLRLLRATYTPEQLPVIMVTALSDSERIVEAIGLGANDYVTKPLDYPVTLARIRSQLSRKVAEAVLRESQERYALIARGSNDGLWDWDCRTNRVYYSPRWKAIIGYEEDEIGDSLEEWFSRVPEPDLGQLQRVITAHSKGEISSPFEFEHRMVKKDGEHCWLLSRGLAVRDRTGQVLRMAGSTTDLTHKKTYDPLTRLPNRLFFDELLTRALRRKFNNPSSLFAVYFLDLDRFKLVNDSLGHSTGDQLLTAAAGRLQQSLYNGLSQIGPKASGAVVRLGGDEFAFLLDGIQSKADAEIVADLLLRSFATPFSLDGRDVFCTASIGIALSDFAYQSPDELIRDADIAMYSAKAQGKGRWEFFEVAMRDRMVARLELENDLQSALTNHELVVFYQPKVHLASRSVCGFEALVRWIHPRRGLLPPGDFITIAEDCGLIVPIGQWVLRKACEQVHEWNTRFGPAVDLRMSVNVSPKQFQIPQLVDTVRDIIESTGIRPEWLDLEITESVFFSDEKMAVAILDELKAMGVGLKMDDFGTGYSCLSYLRQLPFDTLKIDRSFTKSLGGEADNGEMVKTILTLAHELRMDVIAEGIEKEDQAQLLDGMGCEFGQGYYFGKPVPAEQALAMLERSLKK